MTMKILAVCGSLNAGSANLGLLRRAADLAPTGTEVRIFDGLRDLPHFDPDIDQKGEAPASVLAWREALAWCDAVLIASPEYGHSLPGSLKNGIDWVIGSGELEGAVVAVTASTPAADRGRMGLQALRQTLNAVSARIVCGEPIVRGPTMDGAVEALLAELVAAAEARRAEA